MLQLTNSQPLVSGEVSSAISFMLTLLSLTGTYFYVHLSMWVRDLLELRAKWDLNALGSTDMNLKAQAECKYQIKRLGPLVPLLTTAAVTGLLVAISVWAYQLTKSIDPMPLVFTYYRRAGLVFLSLYLVMVGAFCIWGIILATKLTRAMK